MGLILKIPEIPLQEPSSFTTLPASHGKLTDGRLRPLVNVSMMAADVRKHQPPNSKGISQYRCCTMAVSSMLGIFQAVLDCLETSSQIKYHLLVQTQILELLKAWADYQN